MSTITDKGQPTISVNDFLKVEMRIGKIVKVEEFPEARKPAYKLWIDLGPIGIKKSSAQITSLYTTKELVDKLVVAVTNFPARQIADFVSEVLVLGVPFGSEGSVALIYPERSVPLGARIL